MNRWLLLVSAAAALGCAGSSAAGPPAKSPASDAPQPVLALRVRLADNVAIVAEGTTNARIGDELKAALETELGRRGLRIWRGAAEAADLTLRLETRVKGAVYFLRGHVGLTAERGGSPLATVATDSEIHRETEFPRIMVEKAVSALLRSPALAELAQKRAPARRIVQPRPVSRPAPMLARAPSPEAQARAHYGRGTSYYNLGRYQEALREYEAAYLTVQDPPFLFNIAQCQRKMGRSKEALGAYRSYLRVAPNAPNRSDVQKRIAELERESRPPR